MGGLGESFSTRIYSAPAVVGDGAPAESGRLIRRLGRLGYAPIHGRPPGPGEYAWNGRTLDVFLKGFKTPEQAQSPLPARLIALDGRWRVFSANTELSQIALEPELISELSGAQHIRRQPAPSSEIPESLKKAVVAAEDKRFYTHWGIDARAIFRAGWHNLRHPGQIYGGSTITQQLVKNFFLTPKRTYGRKIAEAAIAFYLELRRSKDEILTLYLNHIYLGQDGSFSVAGITAASNLYFSKEPLKLSLPECATIAGLIRSPYRYNPLRDPAASRERRNFVLRRMRQENFITDIELEAALAAPLSVHPTVTRGDQRREGSYFAAEVERQLLPRYGEEALYRYGFSIYTNMDPLLQAAAARALKNSPRQAALVAMDPASGKVVALAGGRDFQDSPFNRATQARRQPGSAFKPLVYAAALEAGFTPASLLLDSPRRFIGPDGKDWYPKNYEGVYFATTTLRQALAHSLNLATLDLAERLGPANIAAFAKRLGIENPLDPSLALALGDSEVELLELVSSYQAFAGGGLRSTPRLVASVVDAEGKIAEYSLPDRAPVITPDIAFLMTSMLESAVQEGTGRGLSRLGWTRPTAGKTGTTNQGRDAWFIGYTPQLLAGVWVGDDSGRGHNLTGAKDAIPLWASFMKDASEELPVADFSAPAGIVSAQIDPLSGELAGSGCPLKIQESFISGTQPTVACHLHRRGIVGWFKKIFGR